MKTKIEDAAKKFFDSELKKRQSFLRVTDNEGRLMECVLFLKEEDGTILAVMPYTYGNTSRDQDTITCYDHAGQHSVCTYEYAKSLPKASKSEYADLKNELEWSGYNLRVLDTLPDKFELASHYRKTLDSWITFKREQSMAKIKDAKKEEKEEEEDKKDDLEQVEDARIIERGEEIQYNGKRGTVQYALFHGKEPVVIRWQNDEGSEEFEVPYEEVADLKIHDSKVKDEDESTEATETETMGNDSEASVDNEVADCDGKKKTKDSKVVKITKRKTTKKA